MSATSFRSLPGAGLSVTVPRPALAFTAAGAVAVGVYFLLPATAEDALYFAIGLASVTAVTAGGLRYAGRDRAAWLLFGAGLLAFVVGDSIFSYYDVVLHRYPPVPSAADVLYLGAYPIMFAGIVLMLRRLPGAHGRAAVLDIAVVTTGFALAQWIFLVDPYRHDPSLSLANRTVSMAYPAVDVLLLAGFAQLVVSPAWRTWSHRALFAGVLLWLVGDEVYGATISSYATGSWLDAFWLVAYVLWGAAALDPGMGGRAIADRRTTPRLTRSRIFLLAAATGTAPAVLLVERALGHRIHAYELAIGGAVLSALVLGRLAGLVSGLERARGAERAARREAEEAQRLLGERNEQLVELDRLKDEFVSLVSHDLRTPLTSIRGYLELLGEDEGLTDESRGFVDVIDRNTDRLLHLVDDLLFVARVQAGALELELEEVDLGAVAADCVEMMRPRAASAGVSLALRLSGAVPVQGEAPRLAQLLDNLVGNALKFTPRGGRADVAVSVVDGRAVLEVADTGMGIPEQDRRHLFERFYRAAEAGARQIPGTGLGLHIAKAIVDAHGGTIAVAPRPGGGTVFRVELEGA